jgi:DNA-binding NtrC family response regulator
VSSQEDDYASSCQKLDSITLADLPVEMTRTALTGPIVSAFLLPPPEQLFQRVLILEKQMVEEALRSTGSKQGEAARLLLISRKTLGEKMKKWGMV